MYVHLLSVTFLAIYLLREKETFRMQMMSALQNNNKKKGSGTLDDTDRYVCCRTMQRLTSDFTSVIEESCRHVPTGAQERPPPLQAHCYLCAGGKGCLKI